MLWDFKADSTTLGNQVSTYGRPTGCGQQGGSAGRVVASGISVRGAVRGKAREHQAKETKEPEIADAICTVEIEGPSQAAGVSSIESGVGEGGGERDKRSVPSNEGLMGESSSSRARGSCLTLETGTEPVIASIGPVPAKRSPFLHQRIPLARALSPPRDPRLPRAKEHTLSAKGGRSVPDSSHGGLLRMSGLPSGLSFLRTNTSFSLNPSLVYFLAPN